MNDPLNLPLTPPATQAAPTLAPVGGLQLQAVTPSNVSVTESAAPQREHAMPEVPITSLKPYSPNYETAQAQIPQTCANGAMDTKAGYQLVLNLKDYNTDKNSVNESMEVFVKDHLAQLPPGTTSVDCKPLLGGGTKGVSGAPVFTVHDQNGQLIGFAKGFLKHTELAEEMRAQRTIQGFGLKESATSQGLGVGKCHIQGATPKDDKYYFLMLQSVASGKGIDDHLDAVSKSGNREEAMQVALNAVTKTAKAMAELHTQRPSAKAAPANCKGMTLDLNSQLTTAKNVLTVKQGVKTTAKLDLPGIDLSMFTADKPVPGDAISALANRTNMALAKDPGKGAVVHGDAHPGNFFYNASSGSLTMIDLPSSSRSFDGNVGLLPGAWDSELFKNRIVDSMVRIDDSGEGLTGPEVDQLQKAFDEAYVSAGGEPPTAIMRQFSQLHSTLKSLARFSKLLESHPTDSIERTLIIEQIASRIDTLKNILANDVTATLK